MRHRAATAPLPALHRLVVPPTTAGGPPRNARTVCSPGSKTPTPSSPPGGPVSCCRYSEHQPGCRHHR
jgi:hypothetical protein